MKMLMASILSLALVFSSCAMFPQDSSICEDIQTPSLLCRMAADKGVTLEMVGNALIIANAIAIAEGVYSKAQARGVLIELRGILDNPVSYLFFKQGLKKYVDRYPGLLQIATAYIDRFDITQVMYKADQELLVKFLSSQIEDLS